MSGAVAKKKPDAASPAPKTDFMLRLPLRLAKALARYVARQRVRPQEQDVIRTALEELLRAENCLDDEAE